MSHDPDEAGKHCYPLPAVKGNDAKVKWLTPFAVSIFPQPGWLSDLGTITVFEGNAEIRQDQNCFK